MKRWLIALLVLTFAVGSLAFVAYAAPQATGERKTPDQTPTAKSKMILITANSVSPKTANITKGTTVIWLNNTNGSVNIFFSKGKEVEAVCAAPTRFALDTEGKYNSGSIPEGGTASVCFIEAGKYQFDVVRQQTAGGAMQGTVVVK